MTPASFDLYGELEEFFFPILVRETGVDNPITNILQINVSSSIGVVPILSVETGNGEQCYFILHDRIKLSKLYTYYLAVGGTESAKSIRLNGHMTNATVDPAVNYVLEGNDYISLKLTQQEDEELHELIAQGSGQTLGLRTISYE